MPRYEEEIVLPGRASDLPVVLDFLEVACQRCGVEPSAWFDLQLATEEACANVIEHAYAEGGGEYRLSFAVQGCDVCITIRDHGRPFDPQAVSRADLDLPLAERPPGGLGLHLMYRLMDEVKFRFVPEEGNTLTMTKRSVVNQPKQDD